MGAPGASCRVANKCRHIDEQEQVRRVLGTRQNNRQIREILRRNFALQLACTIPRWIKPTMAAG
jgi:hypothetical protein